MIVTGGISTEVDKLGIGAHRIRSRVPVLQGEIGQRILEDEVVLVDVVRSRGSFLEDAGGDAPFLAAFDTDQNIPIVGRGVQNLDFFTVVETER